MMCSCFIIPSIQGTTVDKCLQKTPLYIFGLVLKEQKVARSAPLRSVVSSTVEGEMKKTEEEKQNWSSGKA